MPATSVEGVVALSAEQAVVAAGAVQRVVAPRTVDVATRLRRHVDGQVELVATLAPDASVAVTRMLRETGLARRTGERPRGCIEAQP